MQSCSASRSGRSPVVLVIALAHSWSAVVSAFALRNRVFFKLGVRNVRRRRADGTDRDRADARHDDHRGGARVRRHDEPHDPDLGDRGARLDRRDRVGETRRSRAPPSPSGDATSVDYFDEDVVPLITHELLRSSHFDGVAPAIIESVAAQNLTARQNEPRVTLFASTGPNLAAFGEIRTERGLVVSLDDLRPGEIYLNAEPADDLARRERSHDPRARRQPDARRTRSRDRPVRRNRHGRRRVARRTADGPAAARPSRRGQARADLERRWTRRAASATRTRSRRCFEPTLKRLGLQIDPAKRDALETADQEGNAFMSLFTTFGSFSIFAGFLLIFLIFVMLAAERRESSGSPGRSAHAADT